MSDSRLSTQTRTMSGHDRVSPPHFRLRIRGRRYVVQSELGFGGRHRTLVWDEGSRCRRLILRLPASAATNQYLHVLRRLPHSSSVPQIIDSQRRDEELLVVLSWTEGIDLEDYLQRVKRGAVVAPCAYEGVRLVRGLVHSLRNLHQHTQLIHGDLKPANLILTRQPAHLSLIDFGTAWPVERTSVREAGDGSSVIHAAPELWDAGQRVDGRADQFSVSVMLYQLLTGVVPYDGIGGQAGLPQFRSRFAGDPLPPCAASSSMGRLPRDLRQRLDQVVMTGLRLDPADRYPTTSVWLDAIEGLFLTLKLSAHCSTTTRWVRFVDWLTGLIPQTS